jgi:hypothetical protein
MTLPSRKTLSGLLLAVALAFSPHVLTAQSDSVARRISVAAVPNGDEAAEDPRSERIGEILRRSMVLEVQRSGRETVPFDESDTDYALVSSYVVIDDQLQFDLRLHSAASQEPLAETSRSTQVGLDLDSVVSGAVRQVVAEAGFPERVEPLPAAPGAPSPTPVPIPPGPQAPPQAVVPVTPGMEVMASVAPMFVTGSATDFFKYGLMPLLYAGYRFPFMNGAGSVGFQTGYSFVFPDEEVLDASVRVVPLGVEVSYSTVGPTGIRFTGHASGGPAVLSVTRDETGTLSKVLFYVRIGVGGSLEVTPALSVGIDASYSLFFEEQFPLMGFSPALTVRMRL